jgi:L-fuconolactonase
MISIARPSRKRLEIRTAMQIDAHQHLWNPRRGDYHWMASLSGNPIVREVLPKHLTPLLKAHGINKTVLVQAAATVAETDYMLGLADATDFVAKVVGWVDFENPAHRSEMERLAKHPKFAGVRPMIQDIPDVDWMHRADVQWAYQAIIDLDLTFDALGYPLHLDNFRRLFDRYPTMRTVIDHCMKPVIREGAFDDWAGRMEQIARTTPVFCKLSGLATEAKPGWTIETLRPYVDHVITVFGPQRVMWGSDWPVLELNGSYDSWRAASLALIGEHPGRADILGGTAARFYRIAE